METLIRPQQLEDLDQIALQGMLNAREVMRAALPKLESTSYPEPGLNKGETVDF